MKHPRTATNKPIDWGVVRAELDQRGFAVAAGVLAKGVCAEMSGYYRDDRRFRSRIEMSRYSFGQGEYKYFNYPLPPIVQELRATLYAELAPLANCWAERLGRSQARYPETLREFLERCRHSGQKRPTPLLLKYGPGDFNCLHRDLYGELHFPFQVTVFLSQRDKDFTGGDFVLAEQRPRQQSRVEVLAPDQGDAVIFTVYERPISGTRGYYRANLRHGVSTIHSGERYTLGIIFHDAK